MLYKKSALETRDLFIQGEITAKQICEYFLNRIENSNGDLGAFLQVLSDRALSKAARLDQKNAEKKPLGKLAGVIISIKDNIHIQGEITTCGSKFLSNYKAPFDASVIDFLEKEDAIIIGKTNLDEFAMGSSTENSAFFTSKNPWDLTLTPGGSSGGSASAVGARLSHLALGSDTGGSIRQPASLTGIVGFKPTYGRVSRYGLTAFASSLDQIGPFANSCKDIGLIMEVMGKHCEKDATSLNFPQETYLENLPETFEGVTVGVPWKFLENMPKEPKEHFEKTIQVLKNLGAELIEVDLDILKHSIGTYYVLAATEASTNLARFDGIRYGLRSKNATSIEEVYKLSRQEGFGSEVKRRIMLGTYILSAGHKEHTYNKARKVRRLIFDVMEKNFQTCNIIAMPTTLGSAFPIGGIQDPLELYFQDLFTIVANLAGLPAISLPSGFDKQNRPLGLQLIGPQLHDVPLVRLGHAFEMATKYTEKVPSLFDKEIK